MKPLSARAQQKQNARLLKSNKRAQNPLYKRLFMMPFAWGNILCILILLVALYVGNARTLANVVAQAEQTLAIESLVQERAGQASNLMKITSRYEGVPNQNSEVLGAARQALLEAKGPRAISLANLSLADAMDMMAKALQEQPALTQSDRALIQTVMDSFGSYGNQIRQMGRSYNRQAAHAMDVYNKLPLHSLLPPPQLFEGINE